MGAQHAVKPDWRTDGYRQTRWEQMTLHRRSPQPGTEQLRWMRNTGTLGCGCMRMGSSGDERTVSYAGIGWQDRLATTGTTVTLDTAQKENTTNETRAGNRDRGGHTSAAV